MIWCFFPNSMTKNNDARDHIAYSSVEKAQDVQTTLGPGKSLILSLSNPIKKYKFQHQQLENATYNVSYTF